MQNTRQILLGIMFTFTLALLAAFTLFFTDTGNMFKEPIRLRVDFADAYGLRAGDPVQFLGLRIGRVKHIVPDASAEEGRRIQVTIYLDQRIELLEGSTITISDSTLLGGHQINILPGDPGGPPMPIENGAFLGTIQKSPIASLGSVGDLVEENRAVVRSILASVDEILNGVRGGEGIIGMLLNENKWSRDVDDILGSLKSTTEKIDKGEGALGKLINGKDLAKKLESAVTNVDSITGKIDRGEGLLGALISDAAIKAKFSRVVDSVEGITSGIQAGEGLVGSLIKDDEISSKFKASLDSLASITQKIDTGQGAIGRAISSDEMGEQLSQVMDSFASASADVEALIAKVRTGEGNLGKFFLDQELYDEALGAVKLLTRSLEDFREAAPVTAFTTVLFSGF